MDKNHKITKIPSKMHRNPVFHLRFYHLEVPPKNNFTVYQKHDASGAYEVASVTAFPEDVRPKAGWRERTR